MAGVHLVTCVDWNYRHWAETMLLSTKPFKNFKKKFVIAVGEGDWDSWAERHDVTIVPQAWPDDPNYDRGRWCQNVRMRHLLNCIKGSDWLLQVDADVRQHAWLNTKVFRRVKNPQTALAFAVTKSIGRMLGRGKFKKVDDRFRINAGWVLYKNNTITKALLKKILVDFDAKYHDDPTDPNNTARNWDQIRLWKVFGKFTRPVANKYVDDGAKGGFWHDSAWFHCKGPGAKGRTMETWHDLSKPPEPQDPNQEARLRKKWNTFPR